MDTQDYPPGGIKFSRQYAFFSLWLISGAYYDAFTHTHNPDLESFFTPAHAMIYSGGTLLALLMFTTVLKNRRAGYSFWRSVPRGFSVSLAGAFAFFAAGAGDLAWHTLFGIEQDLEAAFSATHLLLVTSFVMLMSGPFVATWYRDEEVGSLLKDWPVVVSVSMMLASFSVVTQWAHPFVQLQPTKQTLPDLDVGHSLGILSMVMQTVFLMSIVLLTAKWRLMPVGGYSIVLLLNSVYLTAMQQTYPLNLVALVTGVFIDLYYWRTGRFTEKEFRIFALLVPLVYFGTYFIVLQAFYTVLWNPHIVSGGIFFPTLTSLLLSYLVYSPVEEEQIETKD